VSAKASAKQTDLAIQIDYEGDQFGIFNTNGDPVISHFNNWRTEADGTVSRQPDEWVLSWRDGDGQTKAHHLAVPDRDAVAEAMTTAQQHLSSVGFEPQGAKLEQFGNEPEPAGW
jgi:hypothetical protein